MLLYRVRHGETDWNLQRRIQGSTDVPLNETGRAQARRVGQLLAGRTWDAIVASPLSRAFDTASIIAGEVGLPEPTTDPRLVELVSGPIESEAELAEAVALLRASAGLTQARSTLDHYAATALDELSNLAPSTSRDALVSLTHFVVARTK